MFAGQVHTHPHRHELVHGWGRVSHNNQAVWNNSSLVGNHLCHCLQSWLLKQGSHTGQHKKFPEFSLSFPWDIWKFQSYFEPFIQISKGNSLPKEVSWRNIHEKFCYSNESYGLLTPLTASLSSTFWLTASFKCSLHIYQVIHKWLFDCNLKNRGLHWMTTMFCMSPMLKWTWA